MEDYSILSGSALRNSGTPHTIKRRIVVRPNPELVLLEISPRIDFRQSPNRPIRLFAGLVPHPAYGICSGWGCTYPGSTCFHKPEYPEQLIQVRLPIIPLVECINHYMERVTITDISICTLDTTFRRGTCIGDLGSPLVLKIPPLYIPQLLGVMSVLRAREFGKDPDIFFNLDHLDINQWITDEIQRNV